MCAARQAQQAHRTSRAHPAAAEGAVPDWAVSCLVAACLDADVSKPDLAAVLRYTSKHLLRCYPSAWRMLDNSNPNPAGAWSYGISLAALNW